MKLNWERVSVAAVQLGAFTLFSVVVALLYVEYAKEPFVIDVDTVPNRLLEDYFPDVIICSQEPKDKFAKEQPVENLTQLVTSCSLKNYSAVADNQFVSCTPFFHPYRDPVWSYCIRLALPDHLRYWAGMLGLQRMGVHFTLFLDLASEVQLNSRVAGVQVGLAPKSADWLSQVQYTAAPSGGHLMNIGYEKVYHVKLHESRSKYCRKPPEFYYSMYTHDWSKHSCREFISFNLETEQIVFPSRQFAPLLLANTMREAARSNNTWLADRLRRVLRARRGSVEAVTSKLLQLHVYPYSNHTRVLAEKPIYTEMELLSNVGGCLGMFLGMSMYHVLKIGAHRLVDVLCHLCCRSRYSVSAGVALFFKD